MTDALTNVSDVGKVTHHLPLVEDGNGFPRQYFTCEGKVGHIGSSPGTVHRKETQTNDLQTKLSRIAVGHHFIGFFGSGIKRLGVVGICTFGKRTILAIAVNRTRRGKNKAFDPMLTTSFEYIHKRKQIAFDILMGCIYTVTHPGLCGEMQNQIKIGGGKKRLNIGTMTQINARKTEITMGLQELEAVLFEPCSVIAGEAVHATDFKSDIQQVSRKVKSYETGCTGK